MRIEEATKLLNNPQVVDALNMNATSWAAKYWNAPENNIGGYEEYRSKGMQASIAVERAKSAENMATVEETLFGIIKLLGLDRTIINRDVLKENLSTPKEANKSAATAKSLNKILAGK